MSGKYKTPTNGGIGAPTLGCGALAGFNGVENGKM